MMNKALVTGGAGFIGSHIVDKLISDGWNVRIIDNFHSGRIENIEHHKGNLKVEILKGDLKRIKDVENAVKGVDVIFHYAANPEVRVSTTNPEIHFYENVVATFNLLEAMRTNDVKEMVFASSSSVYGEPEKIPVSEDDPINPTSVYGASKVACENFIHAYSNLYGLKAIVLRYANVVGPRLRHGVVYDFIKKLLKNPQRLVILGDGLQIRSYIYITNAIEATMIAYKNTKRRFDIYNIASEDYITVQKIADIVISSLGLKKVEYEYKSVLHGIGWLGDVKKIVLSIEKIKKLGFKPTFKSEEAVRKTTLPILKTLKYDLAERMI